MDLAACPRCGSLHLHVPTIQDGLWPGGGETNFSVCGACQYRGAPMLFEDEEAYVRFRQSLATLPAGAAAAGTPPVAEAPQRAMPAFIAVVGLLTIGAALGGAAATASGPDATAAARLAAAAGVVVAVLLGAAFLRIAHRSWRGATA